MPVSDIRVYAGATDGWVSLRGPEGPAGPSVVSANAGNLCRLGTDNRILVAQADLDARYVNVAGDTMTGQLIISPTTGPVNPNGSLQVIGAGTTANITGEYFGDTANEMPRVWFLRSRGTQAAPASVQAGDFLGQFGYRGRLPNGNYGNASVVYATCAKTPAPTDTLIDCVVRFGQIYALDYRASGAQAFAFTGLNWSTPTYNLEVGGTSMLRGTVDITGNITSTGTAHNFAANSITASAIAGLPVAATVAPLANAATAAIGVSTAYARQDHVHPLPTLKADDLSDVAVTTPATGQVLRYNGTNFVNAALAYTDITGAPAVPVAASTAPLDPSVVAATGNLTTYARADHQHKLPTYAALGPLPVASIGNAGAVKVGAGINLAVDGTISVATSSIKADDLSDVTVTTPAAGQVLRWNGTNFVNAALSYADLTGAPAAPVASTVAGTALAATASIGVSTAYARADHVHPLPTAAQVGAITQADADTRYVNITGDTVTGDLILNGKVGVGVTPASGFHVKTSTILLDGGTSTNTIVANAPSAFGGVGVIDSQSIVSANATAATGSYTAVFARTRGTDLNPAVPRVGDFAFRSEGPAPSQLGGALSVAGNITSTGTAHSFANASIPYAAVASPGPLCNFYQASRTITAADVGRMIVNNSTGSAAVVFTLPDDTVLPVGVKLEIYDANTLGSTTIAVEAGVRMAWNTGLSGGPAGGLNNGVGPRDINMASPISRITALKVSANFWMLFSSN